MEILKKTILQILTTGTTSGGTIIIPNTGVTYNFKVGLVSVVKDIGFFDAFVDDGHPYTPVYWYGNSQPIGLSNLLL